MAFIRAPNPGVEVAGILGCLARCGQGLMCDSVSCSAFLLNSSHSMSFSQCYTMSHIVWTP